MARLIKIADWTGEKRANVVFVHGLGGHPYNTWQRRKWNWRRMRREVVEDSLWPVWLAQDLKGLAVFSLGYNSPATKWIGSAMPFLDEADNIFRLLLVDASLRDRPIFFVCHSMGGLIVKKVMRNAKERDEEENIASFLDRTNHVAFLGTPNTGADKATLLERLRFFTWPTDSSKDLVANKSELRDLNKAYRRLAKERDETLRHLVYFETAPTLFGLIVPPDSSDPGLPDTEATGVEANHVTISKLNDREDLIYKELVERIEQTTTAPDHPGEFRKGSSVVFNTPKVYSFFISKVLRVGLIVAAIYFLHPSFDHFVSKVAAVLGYVKEPVKFSDSDPSTQQRSPNTQVSILERLLNNTPADERDRIIALAQDLMKRAAAGEKPYVEAKHQIERGDTVGASNSIANAAKSTADKAEQAAIYKKAGALAGLSNQYQAIDAYSEALKLDPTDRDSLYWLGWLHQLSGNFREAEDRYNTLLQLSAKAADRKGTFRATLRLGQLNQYRGNIDLARRNLEGARTIAENEAKIERPKTTWQRDLAISYFRLAEFMRILGEYDLALIHYNKSLEIHETMFKANSADLDSEHSISASYIGLARLHNAIGNSTLAIAFASKSLAIRTKHSDLNSDHLQWQRGLAESHDILADSLRANGRHSASLEHYKRALQIHERLSRQYPENVEWKRSAVIARRNLGYALISTQDLGSSLELFQSALSLAKEIRNHDPDATELKVTLALSHRGVAAALIAQKNFSAALKHYDAERQIREELVKKFPNNYTFRDALAGYYRSIGYLFEIHLRKYKEAEDNYRKGLTILQSLTDQNHDNINWRGRLGLAYADCADAISKGSRKQAREYYATSVSIFQTLINNYPGHQNVKWWKENLTRIEGNL